jgi:flagellar biosynthesis protein FlhA
LEIEDMKVGEISVALMVVMLVFLIIIPVPLPLLDFLLSLNIAISLMILIISMFNTEPLQFSIFPSLLLITTLFRLSLNVSTTRYILSKGVAGEVIYAFGEFVIGGDPIVGFIIFLIIVIIQFMVITKGAERVSEVAARFTLDAMPGKQMAIDADLNSGLITEIDAKERRLKIQREADFFGAMDGASKFVKGDAIAGILIAVINITAGFAIGATRLGLSLTESLARFTLLTVGDGLVAQIPALMISTATGIIVTRAASESSLGIDVIKQLFNQPRVLFIVGGAMNALALFTPLPKVPFMMIGTILIILGIRMYSEVKHAISEIPDVQEEADVESLRKPENIIPLLQVDPIELEFGYGIIPLADPNQGGDLFDRLIMIRRQIALEYGIVVPMIRLRDNIQLNSNVYIIKIKGAVVAQGIVMFDHFLAMNPGTVEGEIQGIDTIEPAFGLPAKWIVADEREKAEIFGYTVVDPSSIISTHLTEIIKRHAHELIGRQEVKQLIDNLKETNPTLVDELIPVYMGIGDIQKVMSNLLKEGISVRDLVSIMEALADYAPTTKDINLLTEYVRQKLSRMITSTYIQGKSAKVVTLDQDLENLLMDSVQQNGSSSYLSLDPVSSQSVLNNIAVQIQNLLQIGEQPIIVTAPIVRFYLKRLTDQYIPDLIVLSYNEIEADIDIQSVGVVTL